MDLTPEERKQIYEEEKANIEAGKNAKPRTGSKKGKRGLLTLISISAVLWIISSLSNMDNKSKEPVSRQKPANNKIESNFLYALEGDYWKIEDNNIAVAIQPKIYANISQFRRNLVTIIGSGTVVEILESSGFLSPWKRVYIYNSNNQITGEGWILAETVKGATRIKKGLFSP